MNICMVAYSFYETDFRIRKYSEALVERGDKVDVIGLGKKDQNSADKINGVNIIRIQNRNVLEESQGMYFLKFMYFFLKTFLFLSYRSLKNKYDLIHIHNIPDFLVFSAMVPKIINTKLILDIHDILPEYYANKFKGNKNSIIKKILIKVEKLSISFSDYVIVANDIWKERLQKRSVSPKKIMTILNYPDVRYFKNSKKYNNRKDEFIIMYPGSLSYFQGVDIAIKAMKKIETIVPEAVLHIYGEGSQENDLRNMVKELSLENRVKIMDVVPIDILAEKMSTACVGIVPKRSDSFGNETFATKILEFMALGIPVIVSDTKIDRFYFNENIVQYFKSGNIIDLADKIKFLYDNEDKAIIQSKNALKYVENHNWSIMKNKYLELTDNICNIM